MGFFFRKSLRFGPLRLNFSKSGVGVSAGVKGARVSTGPRGSYIHVGRNGVYYRQKIGGASPVADSSSANRQSSSMSEPEPLSELAAFLNAERAKINRSAVYVVLLMLVATVVCLGVVIAGAVLLTAESAWGVALIALVLECLLIYLITKLQYRPAFTLEYDLDGPAKQRFGSVSVACWSLHKAPYFTCTLGPARIWTPAQVIQESPPLLSTDLAVYALKVQEQKVYFLPDQLLIVGAGSFRSIRFSTAKVDYRIQQAVQTYTTEGVEVAEYTWEHTRRDGQPDRRYAHNPIIARVIYGQLMFTGATGESICIQTSPSAFARTLYEVFSGRKAPPSPAEEREKAYKEFGQGKGGAGRQKASAKPRTEAAKSPHEVLGVSPGASREEIVSAYKRLAQQYHPDKVSHLAPEFREMAEQKMREINAAYKRLIG